MFNRFKNFNLDSFLDTKIAEEEARKRQGSPAPRRQPSGARRPNGRQESPAKRGQGSSAADASRIPLTKGPDPSEFVIEDDDVSSRVPTPKPPEKGDTSKDTSAEGSKREEEGSIADNSEQNGETIDDANASEVNELPAEIQSKLRRLQKLETKYGDLLRSYRVAHARVTAIEPFEASLRENTPLTSINEPTALVEYLAQVNLKGEMIMAELKKVTEDRNAVQIKLQDAEKKSKEATDEANKLRSEHDAMKDNDKTSSNDARRASGDDFFSYESEVPRLQEELSEKVRRVDELLAENERLRRDIEDAQAAHKTELDGAIEQSSASESVESEKKALQDRIDKSEETLEAAKVLVQKFEQELDIQTSDDQGIVDRIQKLGERARASAATNVDSTSRIEDLTGRITAAETGLQEYKNKCRALEESNQQSQDSSGKRVTTLEGLIQNLKGQLQDAEGVKKTAESELSTLQQKVTSLERERSETQATDRQKDDEQGETLRSEIRRLERDLDGAFELLVSSGAIADLNDSASTLTAEQPQAPQAKSTSEASKTDASAASKKKSKNKKKKKGPGAQTASEETTEQPAPASPQVDASVTPELPPVVAGKLSAEQIVKLKERIAKSGSHASCEASINDLKTKLTAKSKQLDELNASITDKSGTIDRLTSRLKGEEDLREEIEGLKDDLMHIGNEHVEAKDKLKTLKAAKETQNQEHAEAIMELEEKHGKLKARSTELETELKTHKERSSEVQAELEALRTSSGSTGKELEEQLAAIAAEKKVLEERINSNEKDKAVAEEAKKQLESELAQLKSSTNTLQTDLNAANELARTRYKDLTTLRDRLGKIQPEINNLKSETERLKHTNEELNKETEKLRQLESKSDSLRSEVSSIKAKLHEKEEEVKLLTEKLRVAETKLSDAEDKEQKANKDKSKAEHLQKEANDAKEKLSKELTRAKQDLDTIRSKVQDLESQASGLRGEASSAKEELQLKAAQQASAQSLMDSMQDQTRELATQMKEVRARCESLEEELADSQRLLMERSREGETMRRLLADVEGKADARVKEMRDRMDLAVEERDRAEEDASAVTRRRAREADELRSKLREAEKQRDAAVEEREDFERKGASSETQRSALEKKASEAQKELDEVRAAMTQLRDALDEGERQTRELERERTELRKMVEDKDKRLDKVQKGSKSMAEELKSLQTQARARQTSVTPSNRSSLDSSRVTSPSQNGHSAGHLAPGSGGQGGSSGQMDYVYLKNVLLQFLEQKDKKHQMQLVPVLGMLLHFDRKDEQKWMTAINTK